MKYFKEFIQRKMAILLVALVLVFAVLFNAGFLGGKDTRVRITCAGDSLTYGSGVLKTRGIDSYPAQLQTKLGTGYLVSNYGLRNATASADGDLPYIESDEYKESLKSNPDIVILMLGTNDAKTYNWDEASYEAGLKEILSSYQNLKSEPIVYLMRSPYCYASDGGEIAEYDIQTSVVAEDLGAVVDRVAKEAGVQIIDLYSVTEGQDELYTEGIHFNEHGYDLMADTVEEAIKE
ncbi:MAG: hypothetical protein K6F66_07155 [Pseudobutyrivibrio sp.]|nr:hypothetical protein [Pseudobutyrivibrio sp.]